MFHNQHIVPQFTLLQFRSQTSDPTLNDGAFIPRRCPPGDPTENEVHRFFVAFLLDNSNRSVEEAIALARQIPVNGSHLYHKPMSYFVDEWGIHLGFAICHYTLHFKVLNGKRKSHLNPPNPRYD